MTEDELQRIFEPFYTTWEANGTGLGLNICQKTVDAHEGTIAVESTPGKGSVFTVRLPRSQE